MKFIDKTVDDIIQLIRRDASFSTDRNTLFNKISPNLKMLLFFILIILINVFINLNFYIVLTAILLIFICFSNTVFKNFFLMLTVLNLLGLSVVFLPLLITVNKSFYLSINADNFELFFTNILRTQSCTLLLISLGITTSWDKLIKSLKLFRLPDFIIELLLLNYCYIFYFLNIIIDINYSLKSRLIKKVGLKSIYKFISFQIAIFFQKSVSTARQVNLVMISRSYNDRKF